MRMPERIEEKREFLYRYEASLVEEMVWRSL
jgi:hypothetical protein